MSPAARRPAGRAEDSAPGPPAAWLVSGEDPSLVSQALTRLLDELAEGQERSLVVEDRSGDDVDLADVVDACRTPPFLADRRVVVVRDIGRFTPDQLQHVTEYLGAPLGTSRLVLTTGGGQVPARFLTSFRQSAVTVVVTTDVGAKEARAWVAEHLARAPLTLVPAAASLVEAHLGEDLNRLDALLGTLETAYGAGARLSPDDVAPYLGQAGGVPPWDLTDAIDQGDHARALTVLHRLTEAGARHPLVVLAVLHRHFGNVLRAQSPTVTTEAQAAEAIGIPKGRSTFPARKALDAARRLGPTGTGDAITALADAELAVKGKLDWEGTLVLEVLVARLCRLSRARRR